MKEADSSVITDNHQFLWKVTGHHCEPEKPQQMFCRLSRVRPTWAGRVKGTFDIWQLILGGLNFTYLRQWLKLKKYSQLDWTGWQPLATEDYGNAGLMFVASPQDTPGTVVLQGRLSTFTAEVVRNALLEQAGACHTDYTVGLILERL